jgi:7,8-dihydropterin-6-yl-methyl-4-(beta-D-ribofuranosyl)aminobenzene 5'-phosphate synthase
MGVLQRVGHRIPVLAHPQAFSPKLKICPFLRYIGLPFTRSEAEAAGAVLLPSQSPALLAESLITTGEVERRESLETVEGFWTIMDGCYCQDSIPDDQSLAASIKGKGLVVISGCAHSGIINTIRQAQRLLDMEDLYAVVGGFHLQGAKQERMEATAEILRWLDPKIVRPGHCTGQKAISLLQQTLGDRCWPLATGDLIEL